MSSAKLGGVLVVMIPRRRAGVRGGTAGCVYRNVNSIVCKRKKTMVLLGTAKPSSHPRGFPPPPEPAKM